MLFVLRTITRDSVGRREDRLAKGNGAEALAQ